MALLMPHLGCKAYPIRNGIVHALASLIAAGFEAPADGSSSDAGKRTFASKRFLPESDLVLWAANCSRFAGSDCLTMHPAHLPTARLHRRIK